MAVCSSQELDDLTECSICADVFTDPRTLPCVHTFCFRCLEGWCRGKLPGSEAICPLCRCKFIIPSGGVRGLPKNFIIEKLKTIKLSFTSACPPSSERVLSEDQRMPEFEKNLSEQCGWFAFKSSSSDGVHLIEHDMANSLSCNRHATKNLELYCVQCKEAICAVCFIESHKPHECLDIDKVAHDLRSQMMLNVEWMVSFSEKCRSVLNDLTKESRDLVGCTMTTAEDETDNLPQIVANYAELVQSRFPMIRQFSAVGNKIELKLSLSESLQMYTEQVTSSGSSESIVKWAEYLQNKTEELMRWDTVHEGLKLTESVCWGKPCNIANILSDSEISGMSLLTTTVTNVSDYSRRRARGTGRGRCSSMQSLSQPHHLLNYNNSNSRVLPTIQEGDDAMDHDVIVSTRKSFDRRPGVSSRRLGGAGRGCYQQDLPDISYICGDIERMTLDDLEVVESADGREDKTCYVRLCAGCGQRGHSTRRCVHRLHCFKCKQTGHPPRNCPYDSRRDNESHFLAILL